MRFEPNALPTLIGSLPLDDHDEAMEIILRYTPEIPLWPQLPVYENERLLSQFAEGLPGIRKAGDSLYFDISSPDFDAEVLSFFEDYLTVTEGGMPLKGSRFSFSEETSRGFKAFLKAVTGREGIVALKGQITGPFTMLTGLKDQDGKPIFYNQVVRDAIVKAISLKARYQVEEMKALCNTVVLFLDEPALAGFGSSAMVGIGEQDVIGDLGATVREVKEAGALCGIHVCANTDWAMVLSCGIDILSFDAYGYFDKVMLYQEAIRLFLEKGGILAWGLVPTLNVDDLAGESLESLFERWQNCIDVLGMEEGALRRQSLITPSCGTGLLSMDMAERALGLTKGLSERIRQE